MFTEINIELTSRCNKHCWFCNRWRDGSKKGDIDLGLLKNIACQLNKGTLVHFHNNGEPLLYEPIDEALSYFPDQIKQFDTNGILLIDRANDIREADIISVSVVQNDEVQYEQLSIIANYLMIKPAKQRVIARCVGKISEDVIFRLERMGLPIVRRILHSKDGRKGYSAPPVLPEDCVCRDLLNHPAIDYQGNFFACVKYDPEKKGCLGNLYDMSIADMWYGEKRQNMLKLHVEGRRGDIPLCADCEYYGIPRGGE